MPRGGTLPFFAAQYEGRTVSIRRTTDYDEMINAVRRAFPSLSRTPANQVSVAQAFPELGGGVVEITRDMWKDALPLVKTTRVLVSDLEPGPAPSKKRKVQAAVKEPGSSATAFDPKPAKPTVREAIPRLSVIVDARAMKVRSVRKVPKKSSADTRGSLEDLAEVPTIPLADVL